MLTCTLPRWFTVTTPSNGYFFYKARGSNPSGIARLLAKEGLCVTRVGVWKFLKCYEQHQTIQRVPGSGRPSKITPYIKHLVNQEMAEDDETMAIQFEQMSVVSSWKPIATTATDERESSQGPNQGKNIYSNTLYTTEQANKAEY